MWESGAGIGIRKGLDLFVAELRILATAHSQAKESKSLMYEVIALVKQPKYTFLAVSVQPKGFLCELSSLRREYCSMSERLIGWSSGFGIVTSWA